MNNYMIELALIHAAMTVGYWLFLRKERQYSRMRFYLVASTLLALAIPLLKLPRLLFSTKEPVDAILIGAMPLEAISITPSADMSTLGSDLLIVAYITVSAYFLSKFLSGLVYLIRLERKSSLERFNGVSVRRVGGIKGSFTFFNWIFVSDDIDPTQRDYEVILKHEKAHVTLGHTYDLMFFELFKVCFRWLPSTWFIIKEIKKIHEYQADAVAIKSCDVDQYSSVLISSTLETNGLAPGLASSFHEGLILKRLIAMKQQAKNVSPWKLASLSALCAFLFIVFACSEEKTGASPSDSNIREEIFTVVEQQPEFAGGPDAFYKYIMNEIRYPLQARQKGVEGQVDLQFVVGKDGSIMDVEIIKGIDADCDQEAVRVLKNAPAFKPGLQNGKPVFVRMAIPIVFKLNEGKVNSDNSTQGMVIVEKVQARNSKLKTDADYVNGEWIGTVYDEEGNGLPGVNIIVIGTTTGTVSDLNGAFRLKADESKALSLSFVGYESVRLESVAK